MRINKKKKLRNLIFDLLVNVPIQTVKGYEETGFRILDKENINIYAMCDPLNNSIFYFMLSFKDEPVFEYCATCNPKITLYKEGEWEQLVQ